MKVHLIDGTYELFRQHFGMAVRHGNGHPYAATAGVLSSTLQVIAEGATHVGVASDHVIESFRNELWAGYKTSEGMPEELLVQIPVLEDALVAMGVTTWAMVQWEADDALGRPPRWPMRTLGRAGADPHPDKDLGQCVKGDRVVQVDRRKGEVVDEDGVRAKFGVGPASIADYLGLVGDSADGFPGLPGWGAKSAAAVLAGSGTSRTSPPRPTTGDCRACAARRSWRPRSPSNGTWRCCSGGSPPWSSTCPWAPSTTGSGTGRPTASPPWRGGRSARAGRARRGARVPIVFRSLSFGSRRVR